MCCLQHRSARKEKVSCSVQFLPVASTPFFTPREKGTKNKRRTTRQNVWCSFRIISSLRPSIFPSPPSFPLSLSPLPPLLPSFSTGSSHAGYSIDFGRLANRKLARPSPHHLSLFHPVIMEVNRDEALRCVEIGRRHLNSGNYDSARKFVGKSISLFPTPEAKALLTKIDQEESSPSPSASSSPAGSSSTSSNFNSSTPSSTKSSPNPGSSSSFGGASKRPDSVPPRPRSTPVDHKPAERDYTPEQVAAVKTVRSSGGDFYKVLGIKKDATDSEIKKAYRKVRFGAFYWICFRFQEGSP